ncbi:MAG: ABC transporter ATP-binding protein [Candidatus Accumulibacter sp.]|nr:ABC transporter ATP-binding protein [Accumulibacter sp.]
MLTRLAAENLSFAYHERETLRGVDLRFNAGELTGLLGPNGCGKSTLLKNLLGFLQPQSGRVVHVSAGERSRSLAYVPQQSGLSTALTVREVVLMGRLPWLRDRWAGYDEEDRRKTERLIESLGLGPLAERSVLHLSGGELQKTLIARALVQEGDILLLDEATSGLDINHCIEIMELMRRKAHEEGKTVIAALHDLNLAAQFCDRIVLLKKGQVQFDGPPREALTGERVEAVYGLRVTVMRDEAGTPIVLPRRPR